MKNAPHSPEAPVGADQEVSENKSIEPLAVLVVDDDARILRLVEQTLEVGLGGRPCRVFKALDGASALEIARRNEPDLVVSDIMMPGMSGLEFCRGFRSMAGFQETPFLFLSALGTSKDRITGLRTGADDYLVKPFDPDELVARLEVMSRKLPRRRSAEALSGALDEITPADVLQFLDFTLREGTLYVRGEEGDGKVTIKSPLLLDAAYRNLVGEDAFIELLSLRKGHFCFASGPVSSGTICKPISFMLMDSLRLHDERQFSQAYLPDDQQEIGLKSLPTKPDDPDIQAVIRAIRSGKSNIPDIQATTRLSQSRVAVTVAKLARDGHIGPRSVDDILCIPVRPVRLLVAFTREEAGQRLLHEIAAACGVEITHEAPVGAMGFLKITFEERVMHLFAIKGEKRFSFMWEPMLRTADAALFVVSSPQDEPHFNAFRERVDQVRPIPLFPVSLEKQASPFGNCLDSPGQILDLLGLIRKITTSSGNGSAGGERP